MSKQTLDQLRKELVRKLNDVTASPARRRELFTERSRDAADRAQSEVSLELAVRGISIDWETKQVVEAALQRLDAGKYGICESCGKAINSKRLHAIPWATLCVPCQSRQEAENSPSMSIRTLPKSQRGQHDGGKVWNRPLWTTLGLKILPGPIFPQHPDAGGGEGSTYE